MRYLFFLVCLTKLFATAEPKISKVDEQIIEWKKVYNSFHNHGTNWKITHVPELAERINYTANYVKAATKHIPERQSQITVLCGMIHGKLENHSLTFQWAMRCFDALAKICDQKRTLETLTHDLPHSFFDEKFKNSQSFLKNSDIYFLCVPQAMLKIERFVEGYLQERPVQYVAIANDELVRGGHGDFYKTVYDVYHHDLQHAYFFLILGGRYFKTFWPAYKEIREIRKDLNFLEKNIVDTFLQTYFHEIYADSYKSYKVDGEFVKPTDLDTDPAIFSSFIDKMELSNTRFDLRINLDPINWSKKDVSYFSELVTSCFGLTYDREIKCRLRNGTNFLVEDHLPPSAGNSTIAFHDVLEVIDLGDASVIHKIPCEVQIDNIANPLTTVHISHQNNTCTFPIYGPGHIAPHYFQDVLYLLSHARFIGPREIYKPITIFNYTWARDLAIKMRADAVQILKDKFRTRHSSPSAQINDSLYISDSEVLH